MVARLSAFCFFSDHDEVFITSLCYTESSSKCPQVQHVLSAEEIAGLAKKDRHQLLSKIEVTTEAGIRAHSRDGTPAGAEDRTLLERIRHTNEKSQRLQAQFKQLKGQGEETMPRMREIQKKPGGHHRPGKKQPALGHH